MEERTSSISESQCTRLRDGSACRRPRSVASPPPCRMGFAYRIRFAYFLCSAFRIAARCSSRRFNSRATATYGGAFGGGEKGDGAASKVVGDAGAAGAAA